MTAFVTPDDFLHAKCLACVMHQPLFRCLLNIVLSGFLIHETNLHFLVVCSEAWVEHIENLHLGVLSLWGSRSGSEHVQV